MSVKSVLARNPIRSSQPNLYQSITMEEVYSAIKSTKSSTPGPGGWRIKDLVEIDSSILALLFNVMFDIGYVPVQFRTNLTILIPKKDAKATVEDWRPITVSSIFVWASNKI